MEHRIREEILNNISCPGKGHADCAMEVNAVLFRHIRTPTKTKIFNNYNDNKNQYKHPNQKVKVFFYKDLKTRAFTCRPWTKEDDDEGYMYGWWCCCNKGFLGFESYFLVEAMTLFLNNLAQTLLPYGPHLGCGSNFIHFMLFGHHMRKKSCRKLVGVKYKECEDFKYLNRFLLADQLMVEDQRTPTLIHAEALEILLGEMAKEGYKRPDPRLLAAVTYSTSAFMYSPNEIRDFKQDEAIQKELSDKAHSNISSEKSHTPRGKARQTAYHQSEAGKARQTAYNQSEAGKAARTAYDQSEKGKETRNAYHQSEAGKETTNAYHQSEKGQETRTAYDQSEKGQAARTAYDQSEKGKETRNAYSQSEHGKETRNAYHQSEAGKAKQTAYNQSEAGKAARKKAVAKYSATHPYKKK